MILSQHFRQVQARARRQVHQKELLGKRLNGHSESNGPMESYTCPYKLH